MMWRWKLWVIKFLFAKSETFIALPGAGAGVAQEDCRGKGRAMMWRWKLWVIKFLFAKSETFIAQVPVECPYDLGGEG
jgi:hypothetical protein